MNEYAYVGPVYVFDDCVNHKWEASTWAPSEARAKSNLIFRYKKEHGLDANTSVKLPGKFTLVE